MNAYIACALGLGGIGYFALVLVRECDSYPRPQLEVLDNPS